MSQRKEVWITGIGIVSSLGEGLDAHWEALNAGRVNVDDKRFAPYIVHPLAPVSFDAQIPKKGDQRQMEAWQRIGTYAAGLALDSAGVKGNQEILGRMDMIVAAGGGERDVPVDMAILQGYLKDNSGPVFLNERLMNDLAADAVSGAALEPARRQHRHRPRRFRNLAHLHGRGSFRHRCGADCAGAHRIRPERHRAVWRGAERRALRPPHSVRVRRFQSDRQVRAGMGARQEP